MGAIVRERVVKEVDLWAFEPEHYECGKCGERIQRHIQQDGARYHVVSYGSDRCCSETDCEINHHC